MALGNASNETMNMALIIFSRIRSKCEWKIGLLIYCSYAHLLPIALLRAIHRGVSTEPSRDLLCSQNVWGLWQFYLGYQPSCTVDRFIKDLMGILKTLHCFYLTRSQPTSQHKAIKCCSSYYLQHLLTAALQALQFEPLPQLPRLQHASQSLLTDVYWQIVFF